MGSDDWAIYKLSLYEEFHLISLGRDKYLPFKNTGICLVVIPITSNTLITTTTESLSQSGKVVNTFNVCRPSWASWFRVDI